MTSALAHRGPDGDGVRLGPGYGLGHRRLSIVDLESGRQPMDEGEGRIWVTYNGEIYNFLELREELEALGHRFRTHCDTEVLVHGYRAWGDRLPERLRGMFAFAIVDERRHRLFAARDRVGKKPLYYAERPGGVLLASEIKALLAGGEVPRTLEPASVAPYLCLRYVPDPLTAFAAIAKLPPGCRLVREEGRTRVERYWRLSFAGPGNGDVEEWTEEVRGVLDEAVRLRLMSDVPLGAFLSGGIDSTAVVESMTRSSHQEVVACTMGFDDPAFDERDVARATAGRLGVRLHEGVVAVDDMVRQEWFADTFDEPFADASAIPTYHVSRLARRHVTVALSGDGGDESFAGYRRYRFDWIENRVRRLLPRGLWGLLGAIYPKADWLPRILRFKRTLQNLARSPAVAYARSVSAALPEEVLPMLRGDLADAEPDPLRHVRAAYEAADGTDPLARAAAADFATYLPGDILVKVDRASMAVSLEVRAPFLDHRLVELAARIPSSLKLAGAATKGFLRKALADRVGEHVLRRRKQGFSVPLRRWMNGSLGQELETALRSDRLGEVVRTEVVAERLRRHRSGLADHAEVLWAVLVLDRFLRRWLDSSSPVSDSPP